ncbi:MAG: phage holin family protein [Nocardioides sp.]|uniref:phage holin family protein n=1 Tax=Nocardioides sp. TaxID=35761 RepID=UPI003F08E516
MRFLMWLISTAAGLAVGTWLLSGIWFEGATSGQAEFSEKIVDLLVVSLIMGLVSAVVEPVAKLLSLPIIVLTLGFFLLVVNALLLMLVAWLSQKVGIGFHVDGFWWAVLGSIIITFSTWVVRTALPQHE